MQKVNIDVHIWNDLRSNDRFGFSSSATCRFCYTSSLLVSGPEGVRRNALRAQRPKSPHFEESAQA